MMMKLTTRIVQTVLISVVILLSCSCNKQDNNEPDSPDKPGQEDDYRPLVPLANKSTIAYPSVILGTISEDYINAFNRRLTNITSFNNDTQVLVVDAKQLDAFTDMVLQIYHKNGVILIINPDYNVVNNWLDKQKINIPVANEPKSILAFCLNNSYTLEQHNDENPINDYLNPLIDWVNSNLAPKEIKNQDNTNNITQIINPQTLTETYNYALSEEVGYKKYNLTETLTGRGQLTVRYSIYQLYSFEGNNNSGDYYIVTAQVVAANNGMYRGNYSKSQQQYHMLVCGLYMTELRITSQLLQSNGSSVGAFPLSYTPSPKTTINSSTYTSGLSWSISGRIKVGTFKIRYPIMGSISFSTNEVRNISDVDIANNSTNNNVIYKYKINNLPSKIDNIIEAAVKISNPPLISINDVEFLQTWIWRVESTKDNDQQSKFTLKNEVEIDYGSCFYMWRSLNSKQTTRGDDPMGFFEQRITVKKSSQSQVTPPSRIPEGKIRISNSNTGKYITQIVITKVGEKTPAASSTGSFAYQKYYEVSLPVGSYTINFKMGSTSANIKNYTLANPAFALDKNSYTELFSSFNFIESK